MLIASSCAFDAASSLQPLCLLRWVFCASVFPNATSAVQAAQQALQAGVDPPDAKHPRMQGPAGAAHHGQGNDQLLT